MRAGHGPSLRPAVGAMRNGLPASAGFRPFVMSPRGAQTNVLPPRTFYRQRLTGCSRPCVWCFAVPKLRSARRQAVGVSSRYGRLHSPMGRDLAPAILRRGPSRGTSLRGRPRVFRVVGSARHRASDLSGATTRRARYGPSLKLGRLSTSAARRSTGIADPETARACRHTRLRTARAP